VQVSSSIGRHHLVLRLLCGALTAGGSVSAHATDLPPLRSIEPPLFSADIVLSLDSEAKPTIIVSVSLPYQELQWIRLPHGYASAAEFTVVFEPRGRSREFGDVWERRVSVGSFEATRSSSSAIVERRSFELPPGHYQVRVQLKDASAEQVSSAREEIDIPDFSSVPVGFSDLEIGTSDAPGAFHALPTRRFGLNVAHLAARVALFDRRPGSWPRTYPFRYRILNESGNEVARGVRSATVARSAEPVVVHPDSTNLFLGHYVFEVELVEGRSKWRVDRSFDVEESGPPRGAEFERLLEPLSYIADAQELDDLRALTRDRQAQGWEEFWRRRDPTPETPRNEAMIEFIRRVRYVEQHFQSLGPGWRSDMGRIYIKFGAPDQVESRPSTPTDLPREIWIYNRPYRRFEFVDRDGFGHYVLVQPVFE